MLPIWIKYAHLKSQVWEESTGACSAAMTAHLCKAEQECEQLAVLLPKLYECDATQHLINKSKQVCHEVLNFQTKIYYYSNTLQIGNIPLFSRKYALS